MNHFFVLLGFALAVCGCAPETRVKSAHDPSSSFGQFKTFAMLLPNKALPSTNTEVDPFVLQRLRQLTYLRLKELGLTPVAQQQADLVVAVIASRKQRVDVYPTTGYGMGYGGYSPYGYGYGPGPGFGWSVGSSQVIRTNEGIVVVDLIDRGRQAVVWRGTGVRTIEPDFDDSQMSEMISAILAEAPVGSSP